VLGLLQKSAKNPWRIGDRLAILTAHDFPQKKKVPEYKVLFGNMVGADENSSLLIGDNGTQQPKSGLGDPQVPRGTIYGLDGVLDIQKILLPAFSPLQSPDKCRRCTCGREIARRPKLVTPRFIPPEEALGRMKAARVMA
jgi:hypothetical protein